jgi:predicted enzyme involved in methoxymalonyl-ACP biosynthesis
MTGARYTFEQCNHLLATGHQFHILHAANRFTQYGLIGAAWVSHNCVEQFVMSCRALGLGIEDAFLANLSRQLAVAQWTVLQGKLIPTEANAACREVYRRNGFCPSPDRGRQTIKLGFALQLARRVELYSTESSRLVS